MRAQCLTEWPIGRQSGFICRSHVELYKSQTLRLSDLRSAMRRNQAEESAYLFRVRVDTAETFDGEGGEMTDVFDEGFHAGLNVMSGGGALGADYRNQAIARD